MCVCLFSFFFFLYFGSISSVFGCYGVYVYVRFSLCFRCCPSNRCSVFDNNWILAMLMRWFFCVMCICMYYASFFFSIGNEHEMVSNSCQFSESFEIVVLPIVPPFFSGIAASIRFYIQFIRLRFNIFH